MARRDKYFVTVPIEDSIVSDITEHLRKIYSETTLVSTDEDKGHLSFRCDTEDPSIRDSYGNLFQQWLNTQAHSSSLHTI